MFAGTSVHGQGHLAAFAMLASDVFGIPMDKITLVNSDTATVPLGSGTLGSLAANGGQRDPEPYCFVAATARAAYAGVVVGAGGAGMRVVFIVDLLRS